MITGMNGLSPHFKKIIIPINVLALIAIFLIFLNITSAKWLLAAWIGWFLFSGLGIAVGFHRLLSHQSFQTYPIIERILAYFGCLGAQGSPIFWVSLHNGVHHPFADTEKDLHSPVNGYWNSFIGWQLNLDPKKIPFRCGYKLSKQNYYRFLHKNYETIYWLTALLLAVVNWRLALYGLILPGFISMHQENSVDLFCHLKNCGYRNHSTPDQSVNNPILGWFAFGQGWHNNHHARPDDYNFGGDRWFEFDICNPIVSLIKKKDYEESYSKHKKTQLQ